MFTADERRALLFLLAIAALGGVLRAIRSGSAAPGAPFVAPAEFASGDLAAQAARARRAEMMARPLQPGERVDVDQAGAEELERLPRVGPALARRIVDERGTGGPFGSLDGLRRVSGIGPAMLRELERWVTFSGLARAPAVPAAAAPEHRPRAVDGCRPGVLELNRASAAELACLPGIGPALAERIVADRVARGAFREVQELKRVPGLGPARVERLAGLLSAP